MYFSNTVSIRPQVKKKLLLDLDNGLLEVKDRYKLTNIKNPLLRIPANSDGDIFSYFFAS